MTQPFQQGHPCRPFVVLYVQIGSDPYEAVNFYDGRSGKQIGYYTPLNGLKLD